MQPVPEVLRRAGKLKKTLSKILLHLALSNRINGLDTNGNSRRTPELSDNRPSENKLTFEQVCKRIVRQTQCSRVSEYNNRFVETA